MPNPQLVELLSKLKDKNATTRQEACLALGNLGDLEAIPALVNVFTTDKNRKVKQAAREALTKYRFMENPVIPKVSLKARLGLLGLAALFIILVTLNIVFLLDGGEEEKSTVGASRSRDDLLAQIENSLDRLETNTLALQSDIESTNCDSDIDTPNSVTLTEFELYTFPDFGSVIGPDTRYQTNFGTLDFVYSAWRNGCSTADPAFKITLSNSLTTITDSLSGLRENVQILRDAPLPTRPASDFGKPTEAPTATPTEIPTATPTLTPTPLANVNYVLHIAVLDNILSAMRPAVTDIQGRWQTVVDGDSVSNCRTDSYRIPENYVLPDDQRGDENIDESVRLINEALDTIRDNFAAFASACPLGQLQPIATERLTQISEAGRKLSDAQIRLDAIRGRSVPTPTPGAEG